MMSKNISVIPVTKKTIKPFSCSWLQKANYLDQIWMFLIIGYVQRIRLSHGTERSDSDCNSLPSTM